jgi:hypothetical protein
MPNLAAGECRPGRLGKTIFDMQPKTSIMADSKTTAFQRLVALSNAGFRTLSKTAFRPHAQAVERALIDNIIRPKHGGGLGKLFR